MATTIHAWQTGLISVVDNTAQTPSHQRGPSGFLVQRLFYPKLLVRFVVLSLELMLINTLKFIYNHPFNRPNKLGGIVRFIKWQLSSRLNPHPIVYSFTEHTKLLVTKGLAAATANIYCGLMEYEDMAFVLHFLRPNDLFFDIGANVGTFTLLASGEVGAQTIAVEPVPRTFGLLMDNIRLNQLNEKVNAVNIGLSSQAGMLKFTQSLDAMNHVATANETNTIDVTVERMDDLSQRAPILLKIDVEGFETEVLNGASRLLNSPELKAIIIEFSDTGNRYGYDERLIHQKLLALGFRTYQYQPSNRVLTPAPGGNRQNWLYVRDEAFVTDRLAQARRIRVGQQYV
jgi:FkbM family methyltransferase